MLVALCIYLFATAPPPLEQAGLAQGQMPVEDLFRLVARENDAVRTAYTRQIVGPGKKVGLVFSEAWRQADVTAGPLPALFLRASSERLARSAVPLGLFLGSDAPIAATNRFSGEQRTRFEVLRETGEPQFFLDPDTGLYTAMFADVASADACVTCHNEHPDSQKTDWKLGDVMGATTWTWPSATVDLFQATRAIHELRQSFSDTYAEYLDEYRHRTPDEHTPTIGAWPGPARSLPDAATFMRVSTAQVSSQTLGELLRQSQRGTSAGADVGWSLGAAPDPARREEFASTEVTLDR
jgi:hypothetical protein